MLNTLTETLKILSMRPEPHNFPLGWFRSGKLLWNWKSGLGMINIALTCEWFRKTTGKYLFYIIMHFFPVDLKAVNDSLGSTDLVPAPTVHGPYEGNSIFSFLGAMAREASVLLILCRTVGGSESRRDFLLAALLEWINKTNVLYMLFHLPELQPKVCYNINKCLALKARLKVHRWSQKNIPKCFADTPKSLTGD